MTFLERYQEMKKWQDKVIIMEMYHLAQTIHHQDWTLRKTANYFNCSMGLISENLKLAKLFHEHHPITNAKTRDDALKSLKQNE
jgi:hypothetical protein